MQTAVLLHNVRSAHNVGALLRTADAVGANCVYLSGYTPLPLDRFKRPQKDIAKTALGAEKTIRWESRSKPGKLIRDLKARGWMIVGVEQTSRSVDYKTFEPKKDTVFVFGNEVRGLSFALQKACDVLIEIPMRGTKESLNVTTAAGIVLFRALDR